MGLDGVEIVMAVEEAFDITLLDKETEKVRTPGDLIELVMAKVGRSDVAVCLTQRAFHRWRRAFLSELSLRRSDFRLDVTTEKLLPLPTRKTVLARIAHQAGVAKPPDLERPGWLINSLLASSVAAAIAVSIALSHSPATKTVGLNLIREFNWVIGVVAGFCVLRIGFLVTKQMATTFPPRLRTVEGLTRWLVANNPKLVEGPPGQWSREQVAEKVREIVIDQFGLKIENYREEARFIEDFGMR
ncbi:MAG: hypothetical protein ABSG78_25205 [Verrucomicrobiota bacterium]|jgi:acyl carrier protein